MTVRTLIEQLLRMPMDHNVEIVYSGKDCQYSYQDIRCVVDYEEEDNTVGILGIRNKE